MLLVTGAYFPELSSGGLQSRAVAGILGNRVEFRVVTTATSADLPAHAVVDGVPVTRVLVRARQRSSRIRAIGRLVQHLTDAIGAVDLVHVQGYSAKNIVVAAIAKILGRPSIVHLQTSKHDEPAAIKAHGALAWWAYRTATAYIAVSGNLQRAYLDAGLPSDLIRVIPNGVDTTRFSPASGGQRAELRARLGVPADRPMILFVGVISNDKQPQVLFDAWESLQRDPATTSTLVFVGATDPSLYELEDRLGERLQARAQALPPDQRPVFVPPTNAIEDYYRAADIVVMPSVREGLPNVVLEAMACGLPVVASRLPGSTDTMIEDGRDGRLVPVGDTSAFADAIAAIITDPVEAGRMGAAARETAQQRYQMSRIAEQWLAVYEEVAMRPRRAVKS